MSSRAAGLLRWWLPALAGISVFATASYGQWASAVSVPPIPQGETRVWFYRDAGVYDSQQQPYIPMNGLIIGVSQPRGSFYLDVRPGFYHVAPSSNISATPKRTQILIWYRDNRYI